MSDDLKKRLRDTPNWMREGFQGWKDNVRTYDRAPFEAADRIEELEVKLSESEALLAKAVGVLSDLADCVDDGCFCSEVRMAAVMDYAYITIAEIKGDKI